MTGKYHLPEMAKYMDINRETALRLAAEERWENMLNHQNKRNKRKGGK